MNCEPSTRGVWTILVAAGSGTRFGAPKQYAVLGGQPVLDRAAETARLASEGIVIVVPASDARDGRVAGGATRSDSVRNGLAAVPDSAEVICVHDAARPLASAELFAAVVTAVRAGADGAIPVVPVTDTIKVVGDDGTVLDTPRRASLVAVQTPQAFRAAALRAAHAGQPDATDDAAVVEAAGGRVVVVPGEPTNRKITSPEDLTWAEGTIRATRRTEGAGVRVGQGFDVHRFSDDPARILVLGGVTFAGERGLVGHSDADAVAHAATDALLGAAGLGDIGEHFPDTDERWRGADSIDLLRRAAEKVTAAGWEIGNVDCSVVCERPKMAPRRAEMQQRLSAAAGAPVTVKGRRAEGLGALGRQEGIACWAVAVVSRPADVS